MTHSLSAFAVASLLVLAAACAPYEPAGAPCSLADRSGCGEVAPINQDGQPLANGLRSASAVRTFDLERAITAADAAEADQALPQGSTNVNQAVVFIGEDDEVLSLGEADAELDRELALQKAVVEDLREEYVKAFDAERAAAAAREQALKAELERLQTQLASAEQLAVAQVPPPRKAGPAGDECLMVRKPGVQPAVARQADLVGDGPESRERPVFAGEGTSVETVYKRAAAVSPSGQETAAELEPADDPAASDQNDTAKQAEQVRTVRTLLASLEPNVGSSDDGESIVDQELRKYRNFKFYEDAIRSTDLSREIRKTYTELAAKEEPNGPYTELLGRLEPLPTDAQLRARFGIPANWIPK